MAVKCLNIPADAADGFTLIESVVAMGLFGGAVFLLVTVFSGFMLDSFPAKSYQAVAIAEGEIADAQNQSVFFSAEKDTLGFRVTREINLNNGSVDIDVTVASAAHPFIVYAKLSDAWPAGLNERQTGTSIGK